MKILMGTLLLLLSVNCMACENGDELLKKEVITKSDGFGSCHGYGYCFISEEAGYGYRYGCRGTLKRQLDTEFCKKADGTVYYGEQEQVGGVKCAM